VAVDDALFDDRGRGEALRNLFRAVPLPLPEIRSTRSTSRCDVQRMVVVRRSAIKRIDAVVRLPSALRHLMIGVDR
jgi:hypothetical protein